MTEIRSHDQPAPGRIQQDGPAGDPIQTGYLHNPSQPPLRIITIDPAFLRALLTDAIAWRNIQLADTSRQRIQAYRQALDALPGNPVATPPQDLT